MFSKLILDSHQRSGQLNESAMPAYIPGDMDDQALERELVAAAGENLKNIKSTFFALYNSFFTVANKRLQVLSCFVNKNCNKEMEPLMPAARTSLREEIIGTNAIALSAYKKDVAYVIRNEHFKKDSRKLSCVAAPIRLNNEIVGYIGISTLMKGETNGLRAFIESLSQSISDDLLWNRLQNELMRHMKKHEGFGYAQK